jgi:hypothetical protein
MTWWALRPWPQPPESQALAQATWDSLAQWALGWTPDVYRLPQAVVLHVTPAARLWGGTLAWCEAMQTQLHGLGWWPQLGAGDTPWQAQARLLLAAVGCQSGAAQDRACHRMPAADALPLWALPCAALHGKAWQALGLRRWGQLRALPRGSVAKRWGEATVYALDQAYGMRAHGLVRLQQPAHFDQTLLWSDPVESWAQCAQPAQHLLSAMARWLQTRQLQAQACQWHAQYETRRNAPAAETVAVRMSQPSASAQAWWRLTQSYWETRQTAAPLLGLRLEVTRLMARRQCRRLAAAEFVTGSHAGAVGHRRGAASAIGPSYLARGRATHPAVGCGSVDSAAHLARGPWPNAKLAVASPVAVMGASAQALVSRPIAAAAGAAACGTGALGVGQRWGQ